MPPTAAAVLVPDVVGVPADEAAMAVEAAGDLTYALDPLPSDATACTVRSQDESGVVAAQSDVGPVPERTGVVLTVDCG